MCIALLRKVNKTVFPILPRRMGEAVPSGPLFMGDERGLRLALKRPLPNTSLPSALPRGTQGLLWRGCRVALHLSSLSFPSAPEPGEGSLAQREDQVSRSEEGPTDCEGTSGIITLPLNAGSSQMGCEQSLDPGNLIPKKQGSDCLPHQDEGKGDQKQKVRFLRTDVTLQ